ncbi:RNA recognition motif-containing protein [Filimonas zeae]|uniref:RNA-binding protein n=1 Tax=Filimonas zeae TaxID=1737353 RepID=A0A917IVX6_9BACT|nr:RNA-binding protein [Filimonas zeae]MDR6338876.1 RNA recognition motif-containing protein [Filimonas zeae]GGH66167.1 RNA-binding protein [Filimonas zeae]
MNIYVSNLGFGVNTEELKSHFSKYGSVASVNIVTDKFTGQSRGFAFVEMPQQEEAQQAVTELNGISLYGRNITVNEARPREERPAKRDRTFY